MYPYKAVIYLLFFCCSVEFANTEKNDFIRNNYTKLFFIVCALFLYFFAAFRYQVGRDWQNYIRYFEQCANPKIINGKKVVGFEPGFATLNRFFKVYINDFYIMQLFVISFSEFFIFRNIFKTSKFLCFSLLLYVLLYYFKTDMAQVRQHIAMAILVYGQKYIVNKRIEAWCLIVFAAMMFHVTAIIAFPLYFTSRLIINAKLSVFLFFFAVFITYFGSGFVSTCLLLAGKLPFVPERITFILARYIMRLNVAKFSSSGLGILGRYIFIAICLILYVCKNDKNRNYFFLNFLIGVIFNAMGQNFTEISRIANYYFICGGGIYAYNLLIDSRSFFRKLDFLRYTLCVFFMVFNFMTFSKDWYAIDNLGSSFHLDYTPYKTFLFDR